MVSVIFSTVTAPNIGHERWVMPLYIVKDSKVKGFLLNEGRILQEKIERYALDEHRTSDMNLQTLWEKFSKEFCTLARQRAKVVIPYIDCKIRQIEAEIAAIENSGISFSEEEPPENLMALHSKLDELVQKHHRKWQEVAQARNALEGEVISKYWSGINKPLKLRDTIKQLKKPGTQQPNASTMETSYTSDSQEMADIGRNYHDHLQSARQPTSRENRNEKIKTATESI